MRRHDVRTYRVSVEFRPQSDFPRDVSSQVDIIIRHSVLPNETLARKMSMILAFYAPNARTLFHRYWFPSDATRRLHRCFEIIGREIEFPERKAEGISLLLKKKKREKKEEKGKRKIEAHGFGWTIPRSFYRSRSTLRRRENFQSPALSTRRFFPRCLEISPCLRSTAS